MSRYFKLYYSEQALRRSNPLVYQVRGQPKRRSDFEKALSKLRKIAPVFCNASDVEVLDHLSRVARSKSISDSSQITYDVAIRRFLSYLDLTKQNLDHLVETNTLVNSVLPYAAYLFIIENLAFNTIKTYIAGLQFFLYTQDYITTTIWSPKLHQSLKGFYLQESREKPLADRHKLPITLSMIFWGNQHVISVSKNTFVKKALFASLCVGFMFLFRKSEYLTAKNRQPKIVYGVAATLIASNTHFWFKDAHYTASGPFPANFVPDMMSIYLALSKGDPYGKGATRFFPGDPSNPHCLVKIVFDYVLNAKLLPTDCLFAGPQFVVTSTMISQLIKVIALGNGLPAHRYSPHSLRIGGLVTLFAADVPDSLKQLAGRWANPKSFITYARATLQQYTQISSSLNNPNLVTASQIHQLYTH